MAFVLASAADPSTVSKARSTVPQFEPSGRLAYVARVWRSQDGLPENRVRAIAQTPDGYLWVGTTGGLARFDGVRFVVFARFNTPAITEDHIRALSVAKDGALWVSTDGGGLLHYKDGRFRAFGPGEGLANEFVNDVLADSQGNVWAATARGLYRLNGEHFERIDEYLGLKTIAFFTLSERRDGSILAGGQGGLFLLENGRPRLYDKQIEFGEVFFVTEGRDPALWVGTNQRLRVLGDPKQDAWRPDLQSTISAVSKDHAGNIWIGTLGGGAVVVPRGQGPAIRPQATLPDNSVLAIFEDREQNMWLGTADGLVQLTTPAVSLLNNRDGLGDDNVITVYGDRRGTVWLTTVTGKVFRYVNGRIGKVALPPEAKGLILRGTFEDSSGAIWFGSWSQGVLRVKNGKATRFTIATGLRNNGIEAFYEDRENRIWIGTTSGLSRWDGVRIRNYYLEDGLSYGWVRTIVEDRNGDMLVGTDRGMSRFHDGKFVKDPDFGPLSRDRIWSIYPDSDGSLWIGTRSSGLVRLKKGKVSRITINEGLISNSIYQIVSADGRLWMSSPLGISSASFADLNSVADGDVSTVAVVSYGVSDGLGSSQINGGVQPAGHLALDGELWFPSVKGAVHFKPGPARRDHTSSVRVETVFVDDQPVATAQEIVIEPGRRRVRIEFTACNLRAPEHVEFRYRLAKYDSDWIKANGKRAAYYDNLPAGSYRFQVVARNGPFGADSTEAAVWLIVKPHFYQTKWFYAFILVGVGLLAAQLMLYQQRQVRERYSLRLAERTRIAREMHDTVVQECIGISTLLEAAVASASSDQDQMLECLDNARMHLRLALDEARQALTDLRHDSFEHGLTGALSDFTESVDSKETRVRFEVSGVERFMSDGTSRAFLLVAREAVRNALVHGAPLEVHVHLSFSSTAVRLEIQDSGSGFDPASVNFAASGHFGVLGMRERMEKLGGSLDVTSGDGKGTLIAAVLPVLEPIQM